MTFFQRESSHLLCINYVTSVTSTNVTTQWPHNLTSVSIANITKCKQFRELTWMGQIDIPDFMSLLQYLLVQPLAQFTNNCYKFKSNVYLFCKGLVTGYCLYLVKKIDSQPSSVFKLIALPTPCSYSLDVTRDQCIVGH